MGEQAAADGLTGTTHHQSLGRSHQTGPELRVYNASSYTDAAATIGSLYQRIYSEPPYGEGPDDVADFVSSLPRRASQPGFRLVVASWDGDPVGFALGHQLTPDTKWWQGATSSIPESTTREDPGRTFAVIELAVLPAFRRRGIARIMHDRLLANLTEQRVTLLVRPEAGPANAAYERWGYARVASIKPFPNAPTYTAMILPLRD